MSIDISDVTRRIQYSGSAGTGPYQFAFEILAQTDVAVYVDETLQTLTTDYTVTINGDGTGSITLLVAATGSNTITIIGDRAIARSTDFVTGGDLLADSLNDELDSLTIYCQQLEEKFNRCFAAPEYDTATTLSMPDVATRASKYLAFDAQGNPAATSGTTNAFIVSTFAETLLDDTTAAMMQATLDLEPGVDVQAYDADLAALAGLTSAANKVPMFSGAGTATLLDFKDEDNMASDSATAVPSQQSVKAYADAINGRIVQVVEATPITAVVTSATQIPNDDTIPQNTEGTELITASITPTNASNRLRIEFWGSSAGASAGGYVASALFQDSTANALAVGANFRNAATVVSDLPSVVHEMAAGTTSATTFKIRFGPSGSAFSVYANGDTGGTRVFGGISAARLRITEIKV